MAKIEFQIKDKARFLKAVEKAILPKNSVISIGVIDRPHFDVFRSDGKRKGGALTSISTGDLAKIHEYGATGIPQRSFIRLTVRKWLIKDAGSIFGKYSRIQTILKHLAKKMYDRVQECFDTNGWGEWKDLSDKYIRRSGRVSPPGLTDTGQLRGAVYTSYEGQTITGLSVSGVGQKAKSSLFGRWKKFGKQWTESLYNRGRGKSRSSIVSDFHKGGE